MTEWCLAHPYLTTLILFILAACITDCIKSICQANSKKAEQPPSEEQELPEDAEE